MMHQLVYYRGHEWTSLYFTGWVLHEERAQRDAGHLTQEAGALLHVQAWARGLPAALGGGAESHRLVKNFEKEWIIFWSQLFKSYLQCERHPNPGVDWALQKTALEKQGNAFSGLYTAQPVELTNARKMLHRNFKCIVGVLKAAINMLKELKL